MFAQLIIVVLMVTITGSSRAKYLTKILQMAPKSQNEMKNIIEQAMAPSAQQSEYSAHNEQAQQGNESGNESPGQVEPIENKQTSSDFELAFEERYATLLAQKNKLDRDNDKTRKQMADINTRMERLQENNIQLQRRLTDAEDRLGVNGKNQDAYTADKMRRLETKVREQDELIATLETQCDDDRNAKERMQKDLASLKSMGNRLTALEDDLTIAREENQVLKKKANMADRFKQKLEASKNLEADLARTRDENQSLQQHVVDYDTIVRQKDALQRMHQQYQNTQQKNEQEIFEANSQKKALEDERRDLLRQLAVSQDREAHDAAMIADLQEQRGSTTPTASSPIKGDSGRNLDDELASTEHSRAAVDLELSRLRSENQLLKGNAIAAQENLTLQIVVEDITRERDNYRKKYEDVYEENAISQRQLQAFMEGATSEGLVTGIENVLQFGRLRILTPTFYSDPVFIDLRKKTMELEEELAAIKKKLEGTEAELGTTARELLAVKSDCMYPPFLIPQNTFTNCPTVSMVEKDEFEALEELKQTNSTMLFSLENDYKRLQARNKALETDFDLQKTQLIAALLSKNELMQSSREAEYIANDRKHALKALEDYSPNPDPESVEVFRTRMEAQLEELNEVSEISDLYWSHRKSISAIMAATEGTEAVEGEPWERPSFIAVDYTNMCPPPADPHRIPLPPSPLATPVAFLLAITPTPSPVLSPISTPVTSCLAPPVLSPSVAIPDSALMDSGATEAELAIFGPFNRSPSVSSPSITTPRRSLSFLSVASPRRVRVPVAPVRFRGSGSFIFRPEDLEDEQMTDIPF